MIDKIKNNKTFEVVGIVLLALFVVYFIPFILILVIGISAFNNIYDVTTDIDKYNDVIVGQKWDLSEKIFPEDISNLNVTDFKHVYYNPWDANYLGYLAVYYDKEDYEKEIDRLKEIGVEDYIGYYGVTGFSNYELVAMEADPYNGFVYAITDGEKIIYVEMIFCNYFMDIDYENQIPQEYLPDNFDAKLDNPYQKAMMP